MAYFADLSPWQNHPRLLTIGWLERSHPFQTGDLGPLESRVAGRITARWRPSRSLGAHACSLCDAGVAGSAILFIPGRGCIYVVPELVKHYIHAHRYVPPEDFVRAICEGPAIGTRDYFREVLSIGGPDWLVDDARLQLREIENHAGR